MHHPQQTTQDNGRHLPSNVIETNSHQQLSMVETLEHRRFAKFCDACRRYRYIVLCYGPPGVGKTLSARTYSRWDKVKQSDRWRSGLVEPPTFDTVFYTPDVVNAPGNISSGIRFARDTLRDVARRPLRLETINSSKPCGDETKSTKPSFSRSMTGSASHSRSSSQPMVRWRESVALEICGSPTRQRSFFIDEADRLRMASLEQVRAIFDASEIGIVLIGMPGVEKRLARYAQFYSRIGFVHEFRPLGTTEIRRLLLNDGHRPE
jgi:hypothetical protein